VDSLGSIVNVRRLDRFLPWLGGLVLVAGIATFLIVHFTRSSGSSSAPAAATQPAAPTAPATPAKTFTSKAATAHEIQRVSDRFIATAVVRKHVGRSYDLTTPALRQGASRKEWATGNIPVAGFPVPVGKVKYATDYLHRSEVQLEVLLVARKGFKTSVAPYFVIGLVKRGGHWKVDYWGPRNTVPVPNTPP
jgi:hypothetical protein